MVISFQITKYATKMGGGMMVKTSTRLMLGHPFRVRGCVGVVSPRVLAVARTPGYE